MEHISLPSPDLWPVPEHRECSFLNEGCCCSGLSCCALQTVTVIFTAIITVLGDVFLSPGCVHCLHFETTCKLVGSWASTRKPQLCTKVSLSGSSLGQQLFASNTHSPADQRSKLLLNQGRNNKPEVVLCHLLLKGKQT